MDRETVERLGRMEIQIGRVLEELQQTDVAARFAAVADVLGQACDRVTEEAAKLSVERAQLIPHFKKEIADTCQSLLEIANFRLTELEEVRRERDRWRQMCTDQFVELEELRAKVPA